MLEFAFWAEFRPPHGEGLGRGQGRRGTAWRPRSYLLGSPTGRRCPADPAVPSHVTAGSRPAGAAGRAPRLPVTGDLQLLAALQVRWGGQRASSSQLKVQACVTCDLCASGRCSSLLCFGAGGAGGGWGGYGHLTAPNSCASGEPGGLTLPCQALFFSPPLPAAVPAPLASALPTPPSFPRLRSSLPGCLTSVLLASRVFSCALYVPGGFNPVMLLPWSLDL